MTGRARRAAAAGIAIAVTAVAWGALSFGAVYPWAYWPLAAACLTAGCIGLFAAPPVLAPLVSRGLVAALACIAAMVLFQLVPLPRSWLQAFSAGTVEIVQALDPMFAAGLVDRHAISVDPAATLVGLGLFVAWAVFLVGLTRLLSLAGARRVAEAVTGVAVVVALSGIVYKPPVGGRIYGFWTPLGPGDPFGPFVNKNHFAGWMLLALPLTLGLLCATGAGVGRVKRDWRSRLLWLSTPEASRVVLFAAAAFVMALSLVMTMSRSGICALALALFVTAVLILRSGGSRRRRIAAATYLVVLAATVTAVVGSDAIVKRFSSANVGEFNNRKGAWTDAVRVIRANPIAGTGLNTYGQASLLYQQHDLEHHYGEAHNDYLQVAADGGALLAIPAAVFVFLLVRAVGRRLRQSPGSSAWWLRAGAATSLVAIAFQETVDFSLQIPGNAALFVVVCAIALHDPPRTVAPADRQVRPSFPRPVSFVDRRDAQRMDSSRASMRTR